VRFPGYHHDDQLLCDEFVQLSSWRIDTVIIIYVQLALMSVTCLFVLAAATLGKDAGNGHRYDLFSGSHGTVELNSFSVREAA
jgi:hypothetical protein